MKHLLCLAVLGMSTSCAHFDPGLAKDLDDALTDQVIRVEIDKDAIGKDTDIEISVKVTNKDQTAPMYPPNGIDQK